MVTIAVDLRAYRLPLEKERIVLQRMCELHPHPVWAVKGLNAIFVNQAGTCVVERADLDERLLSQVELLVGCI